MATVSDIDDVVLAKFAQRLAANEKKIRDKSVKKLQRWMRNRSKVVDGGFTKLDLLKLWKGLHYCMWMSDKPLVQEELADVLAGLIHCFSNVEVAMRFVSAFFQTEVREWYGIDRLRLDKFLMLVRRFLRQTFVLLKLQNWKPELIRRVASELAAGVMKPNSDAVCLSLTNHVAEVFVEELIKTGASNLGADQLLILLDPFFLYIKGASELNMSRSVLDKVIFPLVDVTMDTLECDDQEEEDPPLKIDWSQLSKRLVELADSKTCLLRNRKMLNALVKTCNNLAKGVPPPEEMTKPISKTTKVSSSTIKKAITRLQYLELKLTKQQGLRKRDLKRKRKAEEQAVTVDLEDGEDREEGISPPKKKKKNPGAVSDPAIKKSKGKKKTKMVTQGELQPVNGIHQEEMSEECETRLTSTGKGRKVGKLARAQNSNKTPEKDSGVSSSYDTVQNGDTVQNSDTEQNGDTVRATPMATETLYTNLLTVKPKSSSKSTSRPKKLSPKPTGEQAIFSGGFIDSDEDVAPNGSSSKQSPKSSAKKIKKKKLRLSNIENSAEMTVTEVPLNTLENGNHDLENGDHETPTDKSTPTVNKSGKRKKAVKDRSLTETPTSAVSSRSSGSPPLEEGEIEILIPNKNYHGSLKAAFQEEMEAALKQDAGSTPKMVGKKKKLGKNPKMNMFASFQVGAQTPPAFVRKAVAKATPKSQRKPGKEKPTESPIMTPGDKKKRVSFHLAMNRAQDFNDSLTLSPLLPYDPKIQPVHTILKSPALGTQGSPKLLPRKKRASAADFF